MPPKLSDVFRRKTPEERKMKAGLAFLKKINDGNTTELDGIIRQRQSFARSPSEISKARQAMIDLAHLVCRNESVKKAMKQVCRPGAATSAPTTEMLKAILAMDTHSVLNANTPNSIAKNDLITIRENLEDDILLRFGFLLPMYGRPLPNDDIMEAVDEIEQSLFLIIVRTFQNLP